MSLEQQAALARGLDRLAADFSDRPLEAIGNVWRLGKQVADLITCSNLVFAQGLAASAVQLDVNTLRRWVGTHAPMWLEGLWGA
jgi:hypothetical protein